LFFHKISDHGDHDNENNVNLDEIKQAFINHEGCQIYGYLTVNRVPGNFHISSHALGPLLGLIMAETGISIFDVSHKINHLSFGNSIDIEYVKKYCFLIRFLNNFWVLNVKEFR